MVGAGGIGCELLKNLILTGYHEIHIVDLDTITLSNLNRQFLFRKEDIDKSKALTVCKAVQSFNYLGAKLIPHHGNIMDTTQFPIDWWNQFSYIYNALDNIEARRYVNKMALFLKKPLMESGTTGYEGQIQPIYPYYSECFDCQTKVTPKTFPVCTIRSTPSQPVHCITWAKEFLFHQLFDEAEHDSNLNNSEQIKQEAEDEAEIENLAKEANELIELRKLIRSADSATFINEVLVKIFKVDIERLLLIETLWKTRKRPIPLDIGAYNNDLNTMLADDSNESVLNADTKVWTILENIYALYKSGESLQNRIKSGKEAFVAFDKDDEDTMIFVASASNLRSSIFGIEEKPKFDIKEIAGNIIPAIATTNAIISGFSCLAGTKYYQNEQHDPQSHDFGDIMKKSSTIFVSIKPNRYTISASLVPPNEKCASDSLVSRGVFEVSTEHFNHCTLDCFLDHLVEKFGYSKDDISIQVGKSKLVYDIDFDDYLNAKLSEVPGFKNGEIILIQDDGGELENLELYLNVKDNIETKFPELVLRPKKHIHEEEEDEAEPEMSEKEPASDVNGTEDGSMVVVIDDDEEIEVVEENGDIIEIEEPMLKKRRIE
ncbi:UBA2 [[Candida] subhashii]|uniref:Ubiquitin-activating enzyme E1-like n=1 Tax=[Candida] subhashii TaxID=561895 RepID=A0A8J5QP16_9ASCO|nr:UBA2 [[Candida] subhashii]KAG7665233.1 UBA2 [[Candida] subhashii]